jgi:hypothetical protein
MAEVGDGSAGHCLAYNARMQEHGGITWGEMVTNLAIAHGIHDLTEKDIDWLLWECTAWPIADVDYVRRQLEELFTNWKGVPRD